MICAALHTCQLIVSSWTFINVEIKNDDNSTLRCILTTDGIINRDRVTYLVVSQSYALTQPAVHPVADVSLLAGSAEPDSQGGDGGETGLHGQRGGCGEDGRGEGRTLPRAPTPHPPQSHRHQHGLQTRCLRPGKWREGTSCSVALSETRYSIIIITII